MTGAGIERADLRKVEPFADLPDDQLQWLAEHGEELRFAAGEELFRPGDPADHMFALLEGETQLRRISEGKTTTFNIEPGEITGVLPYSRLKTFNGTGRALTPVRLLRFHKSIFPELMHRLPLLGERLISLMLDRVREITKLDEQREKLASLGKLAAGLAHELNNPAGAAKRAATSLRELREKLRSAYLRLDCRSLSTEQRSFIAKFEQRALMQANEAPAIPSSSLEQSDKEEALAGWMDAHKVAESWHLAPMLAEAGITPEHLEEVVDHVGQDALNDTLVRCNLSLTASQLVTEIEQSVTRISELVAAIKEYTYMDQAPEQEIDIHTGIESTLTILAYKLRKKSIGVVREYERSLPKICAFGVELNQVWTNLIVNAVEAMPEGGELRIRTWGESRDLFVEIRDNGPGIAADVLPHVFEPFFTTKGIGEGTGLGLDTVMRVVRKHRGQIDVESQPGKTRFTVRLPKQALHKQA
jgi:signal transduction histidine kinase